MQKTNKSCNEVKMLVNKRLYQINDIVEIIDDCENMLEEYNIDIGKTKIISGKIQSESTLL